MAALSLVSLIFLGLGQGFDTSGFPPSAIEKFLYKQHRAKLFIYKSKISEMKRISKEDKKTDSTETAKKDQKSTEDKKKDSEDTKRGQDAIEAKKSQDVNTKRKEACDVHPAPGVIKGHGPCITQFPRACFSDSSYYFELLATSSSCSPQLKDSIFFVLFQTNQQPEEAWMTAGDWRLLWHNGNNQEIH